MDKKVEHINGMSKHMLYGETQKHPGSFALVVKPGTVLYVPPGTMCIQYASDTGEPPRFIKWAILEKPMFKACLETVKNLLATHQHLEESDYKVIHDRIIASS
jgi:hypothetical protein